MTVARFALRQGRAILFIVAVASLAGVFVARNLPKGVYPEVTFLREQVVATLPGAPAATVLAGITRPLEQGLASIPGVQTVRSQTIRGAVQLSLFFAPGTEMAQAHSLVLARAAEERQGLPAGTELTASRVTPSGFPILSLNLEGPYPPQQLYDLAQYTLRPALSGLPGAGLISVQSSDIPEVEVLLDPARLQAAHLTVPEVAGALRQTNAVTAVARITEAHELKLALVSGELRTLEDLGKVVVGGTPEQPLRIRDVGRVVESVEPRTSLIRVDGKPGAIINVARRIGGDILTLDEAVRKALDGLEPSLPPGLRIVPVYQQAEFVSDAARGVRDAVMYGALFAVVVLALFLRDLRATLLVALSLPLTLGASLLALDALGQSLNLMTLGGLAVAVGLVIDDAVVVVEAVHKHLEAGATPADAAERGTSELFWPVVGTTATTVVVFLPLGLLSGVAGEFFSAFSLALASAVAISLPVALLALPSLAARFLRPVQRPSRGGGIAGRYVRALSWSLDRRWLPLLLSGGVLAAGLIALLRIPTDFLPEADEGAYVVDYFAPVGASLSEADRLASRIEAIIRSTPEVVSFSRRLGAELGPPTATLSSRGDIAVRLKTRRSRDIDEIMDEQRQAIAAAVPGVRVEFLQVLSDMLGDLEGSPEPVEVKIFGPDPQVLRSLAAQASKRIAGLPGLVDFFGGDEGCAPELDFRVDPLAAGRQGLSATSIGEQMAAAHLGEVATRLQRPDHLEGVRVRMDLGPHADEQAKDLEHPSLLDRSGELLPTPTVGQIGATCPPAAQLRDNQRNMVHLTARLSGMSLGSAVSAVRAHLSGWQLPVGYTWEMGGLQQQQQESFRSLWVALAVAVLAVAGILLLQLRSARRTLAVLAATPVAIAAGLMTLAATGVSLNAASMMGAIVLIGLVVKNGILLLDHDISAEEDRGLGPREAILEAARARLRPILMTTLATLVALIPLVLGLGAGSALHRPLAIIVVGGLAFSTAATLFLVPALALLGRDPR